MKFIIFTLNFIAFFLNTKSFQNNVYNMDSFDITYETEDALVKNNFSGANFKCKTKPDGKVVGEAFYFISTEPNLNNVKTLYETELSAHVDAVLHSNGLRLNINKQDLLSFNTISEKGLNNKVFEVKLRDIINNIQFPDVTLILRPRHDNMYKVFEDCLNSIKNYTLIEKSKNNENTKENIVVSEPNINETSIETSKLNNNTSKVDTIKIESSIIKPNNTTEILEESNLKDNNLSKPEESKKLNNTISDNNSNVTIIKDSPLLIKNTTTVSEVKNTTDSENNNNNVKTETNIVEDKTLITASKNDMATNANKTEHNLNNTLNYVPVVNINKPEIVKTPVVNATDPNIDTFKETEVKETTKNEELVNKNSNTKSPTNEETKIENATKQSEKKNLKSKETTIINNKINKYKKIKNKVLSNTLEPNVYQE